MIKDDSLKSVQILLDTTRDKEMQMAMFCHNLIEIGSGSMFPAYFSQIAKSIYNINIKKFKWEDVVSGKFEQ